MDTPSRPTPPPASETCLAGHSPLVQGLRAAISRFADQPSPVLVHGETGSGKERAARQMHRLSTRARAPFVVVHAASLGPESLATAVAQAAGGTLYIDAVEELSTDAQAALLRVLQGSGPARIVAASLLDGAALATTGGLRADLVNRLTTLRLAVPPLRERREDLPALVSGLLAEFGTRPDLRLTDTAATAVVLHAWLGNLRELCNRLSQAVLLTDSGALTPDMLGLAAPGRPDSLSLRDMRQAAEREAITRALRQSQGQVPAAAAMLGISRAQLYRLISRLKLDHHAVAEAPPRSANANLGAIAQDVSKPDATAVS